MNEMIRVENNCFTRNLLQNSKIRLSLFLYGIITFQCSRREEGTSTPLGPDQTASDIKEGLYCNFLGVSQHDLKFLMDHFKKHASLKYCLEENKQ